MVQYFKDNLKKKPFHIKRRFWLCWMGWNQTWTSTNEWSRNPFSAIHLHSMTMKVFLCTTCICIYFFSNIKFLKYFGFWFHFLGDFSEFSNIYISLHSVLLTFWDSTVHTIIYKKNPTEFFPQFKTCLFRTEKKADQYSIQTWVLQN